ncbi:MAG: recombinase family protein [Clostridia bacterium]|nr:recombinase family protein [Clostridia bacterium]
MKQDTLITALYERLSKDDDLSGDSNSIKNQKLLLESFADQHGFSNCHHYTDDGVSGATFSRPDWERMIADIEAGKVSAVIVKDMSRVGRDYLQTGYYTEVFFPQNHVRFIAISNGIDSSDRSSGEIAPFLNIMNEWYVRDTSRKIHQSLQIKANAGLPLTTIVPYGYTRSPENTHRWIIDEEAAAVVRRIFSMALQGKGVCEIARILQKDKIARPSNYMRSKGINRIACDPEHLYSWTDKMVGTILSRQEYLGHTVNRKTYTDSYKDKHSKWNDPANWQIIRNTHEAIIDQETFNAVQRVRTVKRRTDTLGKANPLTGLVVCADCGKRMYNHRCGSKNKKYSQAPDPITGLFAQDFYDCSSYAITRYWEDRRCVSHAIRTRVLRTLLLDAIRTVVKFAMTDPEAFLRHVREQSELKQQEEAKTVRRRIGKSKKRIDDLERLLLRCYEDYALDRIPLERYQAMAAAYEAEQKELKENIAKDQAALDAYTADSDNLQHFMALAKKYTDFTALTDEMILEFIEKITVSAPDRSSGERVQDVEIRFRYIGKIDLPEEYRNDEPETEAIRKRRAYYRTYYHTKLKPKKAAQKAQTGETAV